MANGTVGAPVGNTNGAKGREWREALRRAMARKAEGDYRRTLDAIALRVVEQALEGDRESWQEIATREDGKPAQAIIGGAEDDPEIRAAIRVLFGRNA